MPLFARPSVITTTKLPGPKLETIPEAIVKAGPRAVCPEGLAKF